MLGPSRLARCLLHSSPRLSTPSPQSISSPMGSAFKISVPADNSGLLGCKQDGAAAAKVSELLQRDLEHHHCFFNMDGFHNHIPHHLLSLYGTGSTPAAIQHAYDVNASYQNAVKEPRSHVVQELQRDWTANAPKYLGKGSYYTEFLRFFQLEAEEKGWQGVLLEYVFADDEGSKDMLGRLYAGFLHPMIQLMYGIEWQQPALVASGLAQAAVHKNALAAFFAAADAAAATRPDGTTAPVADLLEAVRSNEKLVGSVRWADANRLYDGVLGRAMDEAVAVGSRVKVRPEELEERTAEMVHTAAWMAAVTVFRPPHIPKFDFFLIHHLNVTPIFLSINSASWIPLAAKVRLLEWKMRLDVLQYVARGCPPPRPDLVRAYEPRDGTPPAAEPEDLLPRFHALPDDDGHAVKVARALLVAQRLSRDYAGRPWLRVTGDMWVRMHHILWDSVDGQGSRWVRSAGFEEAWKDVPLLDESRP
ncbi:hypothetical protein S40293_09287 [Stachybotrys chartarum IBT 40293]|nr:hypothetical protein S40293_09287 [Stachybotrys chartarum IBT 40293]